MTTPQSYLSYFTPGQMTHETLEFILVKRQKLVERIVDRVRHSVLTGAKHQSILLGPRGMGKSHLVALAYYRVKALGELKDKIAFAWLAEEEWGIASLTDLFLVILKALAREYPDSGLTAEITALYQLPPRQIEDAAAHKIRAFAAGRTLFLLMENLEDVFRGLGDAGQWSFRSFLNEHPFVTILATTPSLFTSIQKQEKAFYGFFKHTYLEELTPPEATELLGKVAERRGDTRLSDFLKTPLAQDRVQAVHDLAGGHPRLYLLFAHLITDVTLNELVSPFLQLLDELTPYYQSRMQLLSPQQRKIVEYLCDRRGAITVKEIAGGNLLTPQATAAQLGELDRMGYVRKTAVGRESYYELHEPLLRMVIEIKRGRGEPIRLVVDFLRRWYSRDERRERLKNAPEYAVLTRQYMEAALDLDLAQHDSPNPKRAEKLSPELQDCWNSRNFVRAAEIAAEIIERKGKNATSDDWLWYAACSIAAEQYNQGLESLDKVPDQTVLWVWRFRAIALAKLGKYDDAVLSFDKVLELDPDDIGAIELREGLSSIHTLQNELTRMREQLDVIEELEKDIGQELNELFRTLLNQGEEIQIEAILKFAEAFSKRKAVPQLGQGLIQSIPTLFEPEVTDARANEWLASWTAAGEGKPDLIVPLRLLKAAVEWKPKRDIRALLQLAIEERRILEQLLPKDATT